MIGRQSCKRPELFKGIALLCRGRREGFDRFEGTAESFLASLAPWIAFPLVGAGLGLVAGGGFPAVTFFLAALCALLAPPVLSHWAARWLGREALWLRYAIAFNWCQWALPAMMMAATVLVGALVGLGLPDMLAKLFWSLLVGAYALWLHWFLLRRGLDVGALAALGLTLAINFGTAVLALGPAYAPLLLAHVGGHG